MPGGNRSGSQKAADDRSGLTRRLLEGDVGAGIGGASAAGASPAGARASTVGRASSWSGPGVAMFAPPAVVPAGGISAREKGMLDAMIKDADRLVQALNAKIVEANKAKNKGSHAFANQFGPNILLGVLSGYWPSGIKALNAFFSKYTDNFATLVLAPVNAVIGYFLAGNVHNAFCGPTADDSIDAFEVEINRQQVAQALVDAKHVLEVQRGELRAHLKAGRDLKVRTAAEIGLWATVGLVQHFAPEVAAAAITPMGPVALPIVIAITTIGIANAVDKCRGEVDIDAVLGTLNDEIDNFISRNGLEVHAVAALV